MITLHKLKLFMVVCDRGSFNQAAAELYMAQSAVSQHVQSLEAALGTPLFERSSRGVKPTKAGEVLYDYARQMLGLLAEAEREIMQIDAAHKHQLVVGSTPGVSVYLLPMWLQQFQRLHENISVSLQTALTTEVVRDVLNRRYDLGFLEGALDELDQDSLGRMRLRDIVYYVTVNAGHPWAGRDSIALSELADQPFITRQPTSRTRRWLDAVLKAHEVRPRTVAELDSPGAIKFALINQMGVALLPQYVMEREVERGELHLLTVRDVPLERPLLMVWDKRAVFSPIQRAFITLLAGEAPQLQLLL